VNIFEIRLLLIVWAFRALGEGSVVSFACSLCNHLIPNMAASIVIVGAGLAGLTLKRALTQYGIPATLYESYNGPPRHAYSMTLEPRVSKSLWQMLGLGEQEFRRAVAVDGEGRIHASSLFSETQLDAGAFRASRKMLEGLLRSHGDKQSPSPSFAEHGVVGGAGLYGGDSGLGLDVGSGPRIKAQTLVLADGVHSRLRKGLLPNARGPEVLPFITYNGKRRMPKATYDKVYAPAMDGATTLDMHFDGCLLQLALNDIDKKTGIVGLSYTYSRKVRLGDEKELHRPDRATGAATSIPDAFYEEIDRLRELPKPFADAFDVEQIKKDRVLHWLMRTIYVPPADLEALAGEGAVLIGDAAHAQPILGGSGGNSAILDGLQLAEHISRHGTDRLADFVDEQLPRWKEDATTCLRRIDEMHTRGGHAKEYSSL